MTSRNGKSVVDTVVDESITPLPAPITWNLEQAETQYAHYQDATDDIADLEPRISKLEGELAHLKAHQASLGRTQHEHLENARLCHEMALAWCESNGWKPTPVSFENMADILNERRIKANEARMAETTVERV